MHSLAAAGAMNISARDRALLVVPMFHANAWGMPYTALITGMTLLMPDRFLQGDHLAAFGEAKGATFGAGVPTIWTDMLRSLDDGSRKLPNVKTLLIGGSAAAPSLIRGYWDRHGIDILHAWGMTETSPLASVALEPPGLTRDDDEYWPYRFAQGRFVAGVDARLVDDEGRILPWDGESVGEIELRGSWITGSYLRTGGETDTDIAEMEAKFDDGWLRTGDVGRVSPDGYLVLTDRAKDVIKSGGEWISSVELENALMAHPDVVEAAVIGVPDDRWDERPLASVVRAPGSSVTAANLQAFLADSFAKWQLPERWTFIDEVPKTSVGKFDKKVLRQQYADDELDIERI
jgi:fatty-acyl-CoA synthase